MRKDILPRVSNVTVYIAGPRTPSQVDFSNWHGTMADGIKYTHHLNVKICLTSSTSPGLQKAKLSQQIECFLAKLNASTLLTYMMTHTFSSPNGTTRFRFVLVEMNLLGP